MTLVVGGKKYVDPGDKRSQSYAQKTTSRTGKSVTYTDSNTGQQKKTLETPAQEQQAPAMDEQTQRLATAQKLVVDLNESATKSGSNVRYTITSDNEGNISVNKVLLPQQDQTSGYVPTQAVQAGMRAAAEEDATAQRNLQEAYKTPFEKSVDSYSEREQKFAQRFEDTYQGTRGFLLNPSAQPSYKQEQSGKVERTIASAAAYTGSGIASSGEFGSLVVEKAYLFGRGIAANPKGTVKELVRARSEAGETQRNIVKGKDQVTGLRTPESAGGSIAFIGGIVEGTAAGGASLAASRAAAKNAVSTSRGPGSTITLKAPPKSYRGPGSLAETTPGDFNLRPTPPKPSQTSLIGKALKPEATNTEVAAGIAEVNSQVSKARAAGSKPVPPEKITFRDNAALGRLNREVASKAPVTNARMTETFTTETPGVEFTRVTTVNKETGVAQIDLFKETSLNSEVTKSNMLSGGSGKQLRSNFASDYIGVPADEPPGTFAGTTVRRVPERVPSYNVPRSQKELVTEITLQKKGNEVLKAETLYGEQYGGKKVSYGVITNKKPLGLETPQQRKIAATKAGPSISEQIGGTRFTLDYLFPENEVRPTVTSAQRIGKFAYEEKVLAPYRLKKESVQKTDPLTGEATNKKGNYFEIEYKETPTGNILSKQTNKPLSPKNIKQILEESVRRTEKGNKKFNPTGPFNKRGQARLAPGKLLRKEESSFSKVEKKVGNKESTIPKSKKLSYEPSPSGRASQKFFFPEEEASTARPALTGFPVLSLVGASGVLYKAIVLPQQKQNSGSVYKSVIGSTQKQNTESSSMIGRAANKASQQGSSSSILGSVVNTVSAIKLVYDNTRPSENTTTTSVPYKRTTNFPGAYLHGPEGGGFGNSRSYSRRSNQRKAYLPSITGVEYKIKSSKKFKKGTYGGLELRGI